MFHVLCSMRQYEILEYYGIVWKKGVPLKASLLAWRLLLNRLSIRDNLIHRGIILQTSC